MARKKVWISIATGVVVISTAAIIDRMNGHVPTPSESQPVAHASRAATDPLARAVQHAGAKITKHAGAQDGKQLHADITNTPVTEDEIVNALQRSGARIGSLSVRVVEGIVVMKGVAAPADAQAAAETLKTLGVKRVANLITPVSTFDDETIRRDAERRLTSTRALEGCKLEVSCTNGVVNVSGTVQNELQKDAARSILRSMPGATDVKINLTRI
jgi:osmotically-inducible protein OsmY